MLWHGDEIVISFDHRFRILDPKQPDPTQKKSNLRGIMILSVVLVSAAAGIAWYFLR